MAAALMTSCITKGNYRDGAGVVFTYEEGKEAEVAARVKEYGADIVYNAYGDEQKMSYVARRRSRQAGDVRGGGDNGGARKTADDFATAS